ncbi:IS4/Tn5 family transposase DNA-binding protein, partial [Aliagarivorans taiwanensis]|uniref:IS4/Tn5 family transposase DNA-binding protein n=1 Tax=Aliagarivorans taiwanensis TaxID=561966 RepID=UPI001FE16734
MNKVTPQTTMEKGCIVPVSYTQIPEHRSGIFFELNPHLVIRSFRFLNEMVTMDSSNPMEWAQAQFSQAELNDPRRTQRLISLAASLASQPGVAVS